MMIGEEGDTRKYRHLRNSDYYEAKAAVQTAKHDPKQFVTCKGCGQKITGQNYDGYCFHCKNEPL
jgi:hypothetical protein